MQDKVLREKQNVHTLSNAAHKHKHTHTRLTHRIRVWGISSGKHYRIVSVNGNNHVRGVTNASYHICIKLQGGKKWKEEEEERRYKYVWSDLTLR